MDPVLTEIATSLAGRAAGGLYDLVRSAFRGHDEASRELDAAAAPAPAPAPAPTAAPVHALACRLAEFEATDPDFARRLRAEWTALLHAASQVDCDGVTNQIAGAVTGSAKVVQARDIRGDVIM